MTQVTELTPKKNCAKSTIFDPPNLETLKISPPKVEKPITSGTELYHRANCHADRRETSIISPGKKYIFSV